MFLGDVCKPLATAGPAYDDQIGVRPAWCSPFRRRGSPWGNWELYSNMEGRFCLLDDSCIIKLVCEESDLGLKIYLYACCNFSLGSWGWKASSFFFLKMRQKSSCHFISVLLNGGRDAGMNRISDPIKRAAGLVLQHLTTPPRKMREESQVFALRRGSRARHRVLLHDTCDPTSVSPQNFASHGLHRISREESGVW